MKSFTKNKVVVGGSLLTIGYFALATVVPIDLIIDVLNGVFLGIMIAVAIVYLPVVAHSMRKRRFDRVSQLAVGIGCLWLSIAMQRLFSAYWRFMDMPAKMLNSPILGFIIFVAIVAGALHITAPGFNSIEFEEVRPIKFGGSNRRLLIGLGLAGGLLAIVMRWLGYTLR